MAQDSEASVEEILESIKRVIHRDNREATRKPIGRSARDTAQSSAFELGERDLSDTEIEDSAEPFDPPPEPASDDEADEVLDLADMEMSDASSNVKEDDGPLIADAVRGAMQENLAALAMLSEPGAKPQIVRSGETSLEALTRELLRPMLSQWLDANLPAMVEKMVQAEIARIAGKRR